MKERAVQILRTMGFLKDEIFLEHTVRINDQNVRPDVVGMRDSFMVAVECGDLQGGGRLSLLKLYFNKVIHIPYLCKNQQKGTTRTMMLEQKHVNWINDNSINFSDWVRKRIDEVMVEGE